MCIRDSLYTKLKEPLHSFPISHRIDNKKSVSDPIGMKANNLLTKWHIISVSKDYLEIYPESDYMMKENIDIATALSEWTYYFLISYQNSSSFNDDLREKEILDIFDEISQINQKYQTDDKCSPKDNFSDINSYITKSALYLFKRNSNE